MEIMGKEEYFEEKMRLALNELITVYKRLYGVVDNDVTAGNKAHDMILYDLDLTDVEFKSILGASYDGAYDEYVKSNEKDHIFDIEFHYTVYGTAQVHAKDEDEAREYAEEELVIGSSPDVCFDDDERGIDCELDDYGGGIEIDDVRDTLDEYEG